MDLVTIEKELVLYKETLCQDTSWQELARVINFANTLSGGALEVAINKGIADGLIESEIVERLKEAGCTLQNSQLYAQIKFHGFKIELRLSPHAELDLSVPETEGQFRQLDGINAEGKAELYTDIKGDKSTVSAVKIKEVKDALRDIKPKDVDEPKKEKGTPDYLSPAQTTSFNEWFKAKHGKSQGKMKPDIDLSEAVGIKDEIINELASHTSEWKSVRKTVLSFAHTDSGGNKDAFVFIKRLDKLMNSFVDLLEYSNYRTFIKTQKDEWWKDTK